MDIDGVLIAVPIQLSCSREAGGDKANTGNPWCIHPQEILLSSQECSSARGWGAVLWGLQELPCTELSLLPQAA